MLGPVAISTFLGPIRIPDRVLVIVDRA